MKRKGRKAWVLKAQELDSIDAPVPENDPDLEMILAIRFPLENVAGTKDLCLPWLSTFMRSFSDSCRIYLYHCQLNWCQ